MVRSSDLVVYKVRFVVVVVIIIIIVVVVVIVLILIIIIINIYLNFHLSKNPEVTLSYNFNKPTINNN